MGKDKIDAGRGRGKPVVKAAKSGANRAFYAAIAVVLVAGIGTLSYMSSQSSGGTVDTTLAPVPNQGHVAGSDSALVEVIEFGDFECGACGSFANLTEPDVRARLVLTGQVRFRFMDFPLQGHRNTWPAHNAAWCAGEQNKFWEMHDAIYQNQDRWATAATRRPEKFLSGLARQVGVGMEQYEQCMATQKYRPQIQANSLEGMRLGVGVTPTFLFGSKRVPGAIGYDEFKKLVDPMLEEARRAKGTKKAK
jgi:protein-disulfide isomerase